MFARAVPVLGTRRSTWAVGPTVAILGLVALHWAALSRLLTRHFDFLFNDAQHRLGPGTDFAAYYQAGQRILHDESVYAAGQGFGFRYHPFFAMTIAAALARLPYAVAFGVWLILGEAGLVLAVILARRLIHDRVTRDGLTVVILGFTPCWLDLYMGNASVLAGVLLLASWVADRAGRRLAANALLVASILMKPVGLVLLAWRVIQGRHREAAGVSLVLLVLAVPYFAGHPGEVRAMVSANIRGAAPGWMVHAGNQGLHGLLGMVFTRLDGIPTWRLASYAQLSWYFRLVLLALPAVCIVSTARASWLTRSEPAIGLFLWVSVYLLGFQDVWEYSYAVLIPGLIALATTRLVPRALLLAASAWLALPTGFFLYDLKLPSGPYDPEHGWGLWVALLHHATKPLALVTLYAACLWGAERRRRDRRPESRPAQALGEASAA